MRRIAMGVLAAALALVAVRADACCMVPIGYRGDVDQSWQHAVVVQHDGHEELILRIQPHFHGQDGPAFLEWVVTVPSPPTGYAVLAPGGGAPEPPGALPRRGRLAPLEPSRDALGREDFCDEVVSLHDRLQDLADAQYATRTRFEWSARSLDAPAVSADVALPSGGLEIAPPVEVGPFDITAVRARGRAGLDELNGYLAQRGFAKEDPGPMRWFVEREFTFLCVHITPTGADDHVGKRLDLPALRIGFDTDRPYYPARFSSRQGNFGLRLAVVTSRPLEVEHLRDERLRLRAYVGRRKWENLWSVAPPPRVVAEAFPEDGPHGRPDRWYVNVLESEGFNPTVEGKPTIWSWKDDVTFPLGDSGDEPPLWYYGDRDAWALERFAREHGIAGGIALAFILVAATTIVRLRLAHRREADPDVSGAPPSSTRGR